MTVRYALATLLLCCSIACDGSSTPVPAPGVPEVCGEAGEYVGCSADGTTIMECVDGQWQPRTTCGDQHHCLFGYCVCSPGLRCGASGQPECCSSNETGPVGDCAGGTGDDLFKPYDRPLEIQTSDGAIPCTSPQGVIRVCGPSSTCADDGESEAWCACTPSAACLPVDCAEGAIEVTVECPADPRGEPIYRLCES